MPTYSFISPVAGTSAREGSTVTFKVATTDVPDGTTLWWAIESTSTPAATISDISVPNPPMGSVVINNGSGLFDVRIANDLINPETGESFLAELYLTQADRDSFADSAVIAQSQIVTIIDLPAGTARWADATPASSATVEEGKSVSISFARTVETADTTVYWAVIPQNAASAADFVAVTGQRTFTGSTVTFSVSTAQDSLKEVGETFVVRIYPTAAERDTGGPGIVQSRVITIVDVVPTVKFIKPASTGQSVLEGNSVTFEISTTGVVSGSQLWWAAWSGGSGTSNDDVIPSPAQSAVTVNSSAAQWTIQVVKDTVTPESGESFFVRVYQTEEDRAADYLAAGQANNHLAQSSVITIIDVLPPTYNFTQPANDISATEGTTVTFSIATTGLTTGTTLVWQVAYLGGATAADISSAKNGTVSVNASGTANFTVSIASDTENESNEQFFCKLYANDADRLADTGVLATSKIVTITNPLPVYAFTQPATNISVSEGNTVSFAFTTQNISSSATLWWALIASGGASPEDASLPYPPLGSVVTSSNTGSFSVTLALDTNTPETGEGFTARLYASETDRDAFANHVAESKLVTITNVVPTYTFTSPSSATTVSEGGTVNFTLQTNLPQNTPLWWALIASGGASPQDASLPYPPLGSITTNSSGTATFSVTLATDTNTPETGEGFTARIYTSQSDRDGFINHVAQSPLVTIIDVPPTAYSFSEPAINTVVNEGETVTYKVSTTSVANGTTLWWALTAVGDATPGDASNPSPPLGSITINNNTATFTVTITADMISPEFGEGFICRLYTSQSDRDGFVNHVAQSNAFIIIDIAPTYRFTAPKPAIRDLVGNINSYISSTATSIVDISALTDAALTSDTLQWTGSSATVTVSSTTNSDATIAAAIAACPPGGTVLFPAGVYTVTTSIVVPSNIRLLGSALGTVTIRANLAFSANQPILKNATFNGVAGTYTNTAIRIENIIFDGNNNLRSTDFISFVQVSDLKIIRCAVVNCNNIGLGLAGCKDVNIWGSKFALCGLPLPNTTSTPALFVGGSENYAGACLNVAVNRCVFRNNRWSAAYFFPTIGSIRNSLFVNNGESTVFVNHTASNLLLENNYVYGATRTNISASGFELGGYNLTVRNNFFRNCGDNGLSLTNVKNALVEYNTSYDNGQENTYANFANASGYAITTINDIFDQSSNSYSENITFKFNRAYNSTGTKQKYGLVFYKNKTNTNKNSTISNNNFYANATSSIGNINGNSYDANTVTILNNTSSASNTAIGAAVSYTVDILVCAGSGVAYAPVADAATTVAEGESIGFSVATTNVPYGTRLWWAAFSDTGATNTDISTPFPPLGDFTIGTSTGQFSITVASDLITPETGESFFVRLYKTEDDRNNFGATRSVAESSEISIANVVPASYTFASPQATQITEGQTVDFTVTTTGVLGGTTLWWAAWPLGGATQPDISLPFPPQGSFVIAAGSGKITITAAYDAFSPETGEGFYLRVYTSQANRDNDINSAGALANQVAQSLPVSFVDAPQTYAFKTPQPTTITEGQTATFEIITTGGVPTNTTLWWAAWPLGGATKPDISLPFPPQGSFVITSIVGTVGSCSGSFNITAANDSFSPETGEGFYLRVYKSEEDRNNDINSEGTLANQVVQSASISFVDVPQTYAFTAPPTTSIQEGSTVTFSIATTGVVEGSTLWWAAIAVEHASPEDASDPAPPQGSVVISNGTASFTITAATDLISPELGEGFYCRLYSTQAERDQYGPGLAQSNTVTIINVPGQYHFTAPTTNITASEGSQVTFSVATPSVPNGTKIWWAAIGLNGATPEDAAIPYPPQGELTVVNNTASFTVDLAFDSVTPETGEAFYCRIYSSEADRNQYGTGLAQSATVTIIDVLQAYSFQKPASNISVVEGATVEFTVKTVAVYDDTVLWWKLWLLNGASASDISTPTSGSITISDSTASFSVTIANDILGPETAEGFYARLYRSEADLNADTAAQGSAQNDIAQSNIVTITNVAATYAFTAPPASEVSEGNTVSFVVSTTGVPNNTTLWWAAWPVNGATKPDVLPFPPLGTITINSNTASFDIEIAIDSITPETGEGFFVRLYSSEANLNADINSEGTLQNQVATSNTITIIDVPPSVYAFTTPVAGATVNEGGTVVFTLTSQNVASGTTIYWRLFPSGTATLADIVTPTSLTGSFTLQNNSATLSVQVKNDIITPEAGEGFYCRAYETASDRDANTAPLAQSNTVSIVDVPPTYSFTQPVTDITVLEGDTTTFSVVTTLLPNGSEIWWAAWPINGATIADISLPVPPMGSFVISNNAATFNITIATDVLTPETEEGFFVRLYRSEAERNTDINSAGTSQLQVAQSKNVTIADSPPTYEFTQPTSDLSIIEGETINFSVTTTYVSDNTTLWWAAFLLNGATKPDVLPFPPLGTITINSNTASFDIEIATDVLTPETGESFFVRLYKSEDDRSADINSEGTLQNQVATSNKITIIDVPPSTYEFTVPSAAISVFEGDIISIEVDTTYVDDGTTLWWSIHPVSGTSPTDILPSTFVGNTIVQSNSASWNITAILDVLSNEDGEGIYFKLFATQEDRDADENVLATSPIITITNVPIQSTPGKEYAPYKYNYQWDHPYGWITAWPARNTTAIENNNYSIDLDSYSYAYFPRPDLRTRDAALVEYDEYFSNGFIATVARQAYYELWSDFTNRRLNQYNEIVKSFQQTYVYKKNKNVLISSFNNSKSFINGNFSNMNDLTTSDISGVSLSFRLFGNDMIKLGKSLDMSNIHRFGLPSKFLLNLQKHGALTDAVKLALLYNDFSTSDLSKIFESDYVTTLQQEKIIYSSLSLITGQDLEAVKVILNCSTEGLTTLVDLLNPRKMFPECWQTLTIPTYDIKNAASKVYDTIYLADGVNPRIQNWGDYLAGVLPDDIAIACGAFMMTMNQIRNIRLMNTEKLAQAIANLEVTDKGLPLISAPDIRPVDQASVNETLAKMALGSGNSGVYRQCDFYGAASGLPYRDYYSELVPSLKEAATPALAIVYKKLYQKSLGNDWALVSAGSGHVDSVINPSPQYTADYAYTLFVTTQAIVQGSTQFTIDKDVTGLIAAASKVSFSSTGSPHWTVLTSTHENNRTTVVVTAPINTAVPVNTPVYIFETEYEISTQQLVDAANLEIMHICLENPGLQDSINYYWNKIGQQMYIEQHAIANAIPENSDIYENTSINDFEVFIKNLETYAQDTQYGEAAPVLEAISDTASLGGQSIIAALREARNAQRIINVGGELDNDVPDGLPSQAASAEACTLDSAGGITTISVTAAGNGYNDQEPPKVTIGPFGGVFGGSGSGATAVATVKNGSITAIEVLTPGSGYSVANGCIPVSVEPPPTAARLGDAVVEGSFAGSAYTGNDPVPDNLIADANASYNVTDAITVITECNCDCWDDTPY
jgi:hypothetical protein